MTLPKQAPYDRRVHRVAFPHRSVETASLVGPDERAALERLIGLTDLFQLDTSGRRKIVPGLEDYVGDHREYVLAPFAYPSESRFSDGSFGVFYASESRETAIREVVARLSRTYSDGSAPAQETTKQHLTIRCRASDLAETRRKRAPKLPRGIYDPVDYRAARSFGATVRKSFAGLIYDSERHAGGVCLALFTPRVLSDARLGGLLTLVWDGAQFVEWRDIHRL